MNRNPSSRQETAAASKTQPGIWPQSASTTELIAGARRGEDSAVNQLLDRYRNSLNQLVRMRLDKKIQTRIDVSDIVQNVMVEANRRLQKYLQAPMMPFHLWLRQIAQDRIIDAHRRHRVSARRSVDREQNMAVPGGFQESSVQLASLLRDSTITPAAAALRKELAKQVEESIALLSDQDAEVILMRHYEHLSNQEISQVLGISEPASSMRYLRAIRRLREVIQGETESDQVNAVGKQLQD